MVAVHMVPSQPPCDEDCRLHLVEPRLLDETGHCLSLASSVCQAAAGRPVTVWAARDARLPEFPPWVRVERHFHRRLRRLQALLLFRRLLRAPGRVLVPTAGHLDLLLLEAAALGRPIPPGKVHLLFHWFRDSPAKRLTLRRVARRQPGLSLLATTTSVVDLFRSCGVGRAEVVPYPLAPPVAAPPGAAPFSHVLFAGAPRQDKGFGRLVAWVEHLARHGDRLPVVLQRDPGGGARYEEATRRDLIRLDAAAYQALRVEPDPLPVARYTALFEGGLCLQPYDPIEYADRLSGVTLDALGAGCPVVAVARTWMARHVARFGAGAVAADASPPALQAAVREVVDDYAARAAQARHAGLALRREFEGGALYRLVAGQDDAAGAHAPP
jgi:hypothetical protein